MIRGANNHSDACDCSVCGCAMQWHGDEDDDPICDGCEREQFVERAEKAEARVAELQADLERRAEEGPAILQHRCGGCGNKLADHCLTYERGPSTLACPQTRFVSDIVQPAVIDQENKR